MPILMPDDLATSFMIEALENLAAKPIKTAETFRNAVLGDGMFAANPLLGFPDSKDVLYVQNMIRTTIAGGRMIDFGFMPNEMIKTESIRSRPMFEAGELQHPYEDWLGVSAWEGGMCGYLVCPHPDRPDETVVIELYGVELDLSPPAIILYDMVSIHATPEGTNVSPAHMKDPSQNTEKELWSRGANSLDPLVTMLRLLADASVPVTDNPSPVKLNKARLKRDRFLIPPHATVHTKDYVTAFHAAKIERKPGKGGHHASPIAHTRREHKRHLRSGKVVPVRSSKVNWRDNAELHRLFYRVPS